MERCRLEPVHGFRIGCASRAEADRDSKAGVSKRLVHPTTPRQGGRAQAPTQRPFDSGGSYLASQLPDRGNGPTHRFAQPQRTPLASSKRVEQSPFHSARRRSFPISSLFFFFFFSLCSPRFPYASMRSSGSGGHVALSSSQHRQNPSVTPSVRWTVIK